MARTDVNRFGEMEMFVRTIDAGSFSAAARAAHLSPSAVSKLISRLEARLNARLVNRSTRRIQLTPEGAEFYERSQRLLAELDDAEQAAAGALAPRGKLRINANVPVGTQILLPLMPAFCALYPAVAVDISLTDKVVDLVEERTDVALRSGPLKNSRLMARKLGETRLLLVAAPGYLARHGTPSVPADLETHERLSLCYARVNETWPFVVDGRPLSLSPRGPVRISDGEALRQLALSGLGIARLARFQVADDIAQGRLVPVLEDFDAGECEEVHAVFLGQGGHLPARVRAFLDFMVENVRLG